MNERDDNVKWLDVAGLVTTGAPRRGGPMVRGGGARDVARDAL